VEINDKHFEIVLRQMFSKVVIDESGDSVEMLPGDVVEWTVLDFARQESSKRSELLLVK